MEHCALYLSRYLRYFTLGLLSGLAFVFSAIGAFQIHYSLFQEVAIATAMEYYGAERRHIASFPYFEFL